MFIRFSEGKRWLDQHGYHCRAYLPGCCGRRLDSPDERLPQVQGGIDEQAGGRTALAAPAVLSLIPCRRALYLGGFYFPPLF